MVDNRDLIEFIVKRMFSVKKTQWNSGLCIPECFECIAGAFGSSVVADFAFIREV